MKNTKKKQTDRFAFLCLALSDILSIKHCASR